MTLSLGSSTPTTTATLNSHLLIAFSNFITAPDDLKDKFADCLQTDFDGWETRTNV